MPWAALAIFSHGLNFNRMCKLYSSPSDRPDTTATKLATDYGDLHKCYTQTTQPNATAGLGFANTASWYTSACTKAHSMGDKQANSDAAHHVYDLANLN